MKELGILLRNNFQCLIGSLQGKKNRKKNGVVITITILAYLAICAMVGLQYSGLFNAMKMIPEIPIFNSIQVAIMMTLILSFQTMSGRAKTQDSDLLLSMPLKKINIVISKTIYKYLVSFIFVGIAIIPTIVLYFIYLGSSISIVLWLLFIWLLLPLLSISVTFVIDFLTITLFNKVKYSNLLKSLFVVIIFGTFMAFYIKSAIVMGGVTINSLDDFLNTNLIVGWFVKVVCWNDFLSLLWIMILIIPLFVIGVILYTCVFGKSFATYRNKDTNVVYKSANVFGTLVGKEFRRYFTTPVYLINTIVGPIMLVVICVLAIVFGDKLNSLLGMTTKSDILPFLIAISLFMCAMTQISCVTISLEGKYFWILKTSPIKVSHLFIAKAMPNMILFVPVHLITSVILNIYFGAELYIWILYLLLPVILNVAISFGGIYANLHLPKLDWDNEAQVVKSGLSVLVSMFISIFIAMIPLLLNFIGLSIYLCGYITLGLYVIVAICILAILFTDGKKRFQNIQC